MVGKGELIGQDYTINTIVSTASRIPRTRRYRGLFPRISTMQELLGDRRRRHI
jgi:hypothetical protein